MAEAAFPACNLRWIKRQSGETNSAASNNRMPSIAGFVRKWRSQGESNPCFGLERATS
jgi:hypothetical protein